MSTEEQQPTEAEVGASLLLEISNAMVRVYKDQFGRGPERLARSGRDPMPSSCTWSARSLPPSAT